MFSRTMDILSASLDWAAERQKILMHNIANVDTPGYKRMDLPFPKVLQEKLALAGTHPRHLPGVSRTERGFSAGRGWGLARVDNNNVDLDAEMARLAENTMYYQGVAQGLTGQVRSLRTAIGGR